LTINIALAARVHIASVRMFVYLRPRWSLVVLAAAADSAALATATVALPVQSTLPARQVLSSKSVVVTDRARMMHRCFRRGTEHGRKEPQLCKETACGSAVALPWTTRLAVRCQTTSGRQAVGQHGPSHTRRLGPAHTISGLILQEPGW
jgi:hypothetical protein